MLTYIPPSERPVLSSAPKEAPWHLLLLCAVWLLPGLVGHDPWKPAENQTVAVIQHMLHSGNWLLPQLAGPFSAVVMDPPYASGAATLASASSIAARSWPSMTSVRAPKA